MKECSKAVLRRLRDSNFINRYFCGHGIDIGGRPDPLALYTELFPLIKSIRTWDREDGDGQLMTGVDAGSFDFVHASHCLEHMHDPKEALTNWMRILRPGGYLLITVPDEDLYEQGIFPSTFNKDHKWGFTIWKARSFNERSINLIDLFTSLGEEVDILKIERIDQAYRYTLPRYDQTILPVAEAALEVVVRKRPAEEIVAGGRILLVMQPDQEMRRHLNQYLDDMETLKRNNEGRPPFTNDSEL